MSEILTQAGMSQDKIEAFIQPAETKMN